MPRASIREMSPDSQIIPMTADGTREVFRRTPDLGAFRMISKPFELRDLAASVEGTHNPA